jgi:hypothetical protein
MRIGKHVLTAALAALVIAAFCTAAAATSPPVTPTATATATGTVKLLHKDAKGKLVAFGIETKDAKGRPLALKILVTPKTKYALGALCATVRALKVAGSVTVTLAAPLKDRKGTATLVKIALPPAAPGKPAPAAPAPRTSGG